MDRPAHRRTCGRSWRRSGKIYLADPSPWTRMIQELYSPMRVAATAMRIKNHQFQIGLLRPRIDRKRLSTLKAEWCFPCQRCSLNFRSRLSNSGSVSCFMRGRMSMLMPLNSGRLLCAGLNTSEKEFVAIGSAWNLESDLFIHIFVAQTWRIRDPDRYPSRDEMSSELQLYPALL